MLLEENNSLLIPPPPQIFLHCCLLSQAMLPLFSWPILPLVRFLLQTSGAFGLLLLSYLDPLQSSFHPMHFSEIALTKITDDITTKSKGLYLVHPLLGLSSAFVARSLLTKLSTTLASVA